MRPHVLSRCLAVVLLLVGGSGIVAVAPAEAANNSGSRTPVMAQDRLTAAEMAAFFHANAPDQTKQPYRATVTVETLARYFIEEGRLEGVSGDIAFAQSIHETGWFHFRDDRQVRPEYNNFGGLGACDGGTCTVAQFDTARIGVRAQIQHLRAYADPTVTKDNLAKPLVSPRFDVVQPKGRAPLWENFGGIDPVHGGVNWASDEMYADRVLTLYARMLRWANARNGGKTGSFTDVRGGTHYRNIEALFASGATSGCTDFAYCPFHSTSRAQTATLLARAMGLSGSSNNHFTDARNPHRPYINALADRGIVALGFAMGVSVDAVPDAMLPRRGPNYALRVQGASTCTNLTSIRIRGGAFLSNNLRVRE
jgi:hypothetical protein